MMIDYEEEGRPEGRHPDDDGLWEIIDDLKSDCIDDPEDYLEWLITDGVGWLEELIGYRQKERG